MRHPVLALVWQCWHLTCRWYVLVMAVAIAFQMAMMNLSQPASMKLPPWVTYRELMAAPAFVLNFTLAVFTTLFAITVGGRGGFAQRFEFRLPVSTRLLVAVPMLYLGVACASLYVVPVLLSRLLYGIPFPILPVAAILIIVVMALATGSWSTTGTSTRTLAIIMAGMGLLRLFSWMHPFNTRTVVKPGEPVFSNSIVALSLLDYALLALVALLLFALTTYSVNLQRRNESWSLPKLNLRKQAATSTTEATHSASRQSGTLTERIGDIFKVKCPVGAPWRAELWLEMKHYGMPVLALGSVLALALPPLLLAANRLEWNSMKDLAWMPALAVFFIGIGVAFLNRRQSNSGYMNSFEGTRGMTTLQLAGIQFLVSGATTFAGMLMNGISLWLCWPLLGKPGFVIARIQEWLAAFGDASLLTQLGDIATFGVAYLAIIALFAFVHSCSVFWGRKSLYLMLAFVLYCIFFTAAAATPKVELAYIQRHMWGFAALMLLLTLFALGRVLYLKLLSLRSGITSLCGWLAFLLCAWFSLQNMDIDLMHQAPELQAFNAALLALPFTLFLLITWSYDKLRHR